MSDNTASISSKLKLIETSVLGILRGLVSLPLEHPFDTIKTWMQSQQTSARESARIIYERKGLKGFYSGFTINSARVVSKSAYRWPLSIQLMSKFRIFFKGSSNSYSKAGVATGITTALIESGIICPFERVKVWMMTTPTYSQLLSFFKLSSLKSLFDGFGPVVMKQTVSWVSFLGSQEYLKQVLYTIKSKTPQQYQLTTLDLTYVSFGVCLCNTLFVMPFDFIKTKYQKFNSSNLNTPLLIMIKDVFRKDGIRVFYRGSLVKIVQFNINAYFTVQLFERLLKSYEK